MTMSKTPAAIRIDVDSTRDIALLPELLDLLTRLGIKGTFFITTGPDRLALNFLKHLAHPRSYAQFIKSRPLRYGAHSLNGILRSTEVEAASPEILLRVKEDGHELGLHGYDHFTWISKLSMMDETAIKQLINTGITALESVTKAEAKSFASPGFTVTSALLRAIDAFDFDYSSDFKSNRPIPPFYPETGSDMSGVLEVPVSMDSIGELFTKGLSADEIKARISACADVWHSNRLPFVVYAHPAYELGCQKGLFASVLQDLHEDPRFEFSTLAQIARQWKVRV
jgi:undecaprenyl phosphate-alpha-L-ara4FN deformylase